MKPKYSFEIEVDVETDRYNQWANWSSIGAEGNDLEELLESIGGTITDQDGGDLYCGPCDEQWAVEAITEAYWESKDKHREKHETFGDFKARMESEKPYQEPDCMDREDD